LIEKYVAGAILPAKELLIDFSAGYMYYQMKSLYPSICSWKKLETSKNLIIPSFGRSI
jgi:hypothetical protein